MKIHFEHYPLFSKKMILVVVFVALVFSCTKNTNDPTSVTAKYCGTIDWKNTIGLSGYFTGAMNLGHYNLVAANLTESGTDHLVVFHRTNGTNQILNDQSGMTFTYNQDKLVKIVMGDGTGTGSGTFTFDTNSHLTNSDIESSDETGTSSLKFSYTYDVNDDPVKIVGHLVSTSSSGTSTADYDITADYLTDKTNFLPLVPEITPFTIYFSYSWFLSRHLINKWVIKIDGTTDEGAAIPTINFTQQYTYTYDTSGHIATMVHTGNSKNIYTFTYSGCN
jgi:YD repeat-containing protein